MAKGYHSRSPEEFKEYLESIKQKPRSPFWKQFIIFVDIIIIMVIFYLVYQFINPGSMNLSQKSVVENFDGLRLSLSASQIQSTDGALLYLVVDNKSGKAVTIPNQDWVMKFYWLTEEDETCGMGEYLFEQRVREIAPESTALFEIPLPPPSTTSPLEKCKKNHFNERKMFGIGSFQKRILQLKVNILQKEETAEFRIGLNPYKRD